jgi:membrane protease YdiL (CAAX protease family)
VTEMDANKETTSNRHIWIFLALTCLLSWPFWLASGVLPRRGLGAFDFRWLFAQIGVFGPSLAALIVSGIVRKESRYNALRILPTLLLPLVLPGILIAASAPPGVTEFQPLPSVATAVVSIAVILFFSPLNRRLASPGTGETYGRPGVKWILLSVVFLPCLFLLAWLLVNLQGGDWTISAFEGSLGSFAWILLVSFAHNLLLGGSLGEEIGWRGFLLPKLLKKHSPLVASLILGVVWALWHLPIDLYAGYLLEGPAAILIRTISVIPLAILFTWFYLQSKGNLLVALFLHTSINILSDLGFSQYDGSATWFAILTAIVALVVSRYSRVFWSVSWHTWRT